MLLPDQIFLYLSVILIIPIFPFPDYKLPFTLCTDAFALGIGAVLMQIVEDKHPHVIAYASRTLTHGESRYYSTHVKFRWKLLKLFGHLMDVLLDGS